jgi:integrase/recombinase XerC
MLPDQLKSFLQFTKFEKRMSEHTIAAYSNDLNSFIHYLLVTYELQAAGEIQLFHLRSYLVHLNELKYTPAAVRRKLSAVKSFLKFLLKRGAISENPALTLKAPKIPLRLPVFLEQEQSRKLFTTVQYPEGFEGLTHQLIMELLYQTGIRRSELIYLKEVDIDFYRREIVVLGKRNKERAIPIGEELCNLIKLYQKEKSECVACEHNYLLTLSSGKSLYDNYVYRVVKRYLGEDITTLQKRSPHVLRHTFATHLANNGADISAIKDLLGHSSLAATQIYTHNNIEHLKKVYQKAHPKASDQSQ